MRIAYALRFFFTLSIPNKQRWKVTEIKLKT